MGSKNNPSYRIIVIDSRKRRDCGFYIDKIGFFNPLNKQFSFDFEKYNNWIFKGAQPTRRVSFIKNWIIKKTKA